VISHGTKHASQQVQPCQFCIKKFQDISRPGALRDRLGQREDQFFATVFFGSGLLFLGMLVDRI
jgi:hypothetical protein